MTLDDDKSGDPHDEVVRLEERIEDLAEKIESCRKFILASRIKILVSAGLIDLRALPGATSGIANQPMPGVDRSGINGE
jgi:hypothetical protein